MKKTKSLYHGHRFPAIVISCAVRWYFRFSLSLRDIEELLLERGVVVTYETIRCWCDKFGAGFAQCAKAVRRKPGSTWHLDEMFVTLRGEPYLGSVAVTRRVSCALAIRATGRLMTTLNPALARVLKRLHYPLDVILTCVRWYVAYPLSLRHLEEMMAERGISVDHSTVHRWAIKVLPVLEKAFRQVEHTKNLRKKGGVHIKSYCLLRLPLHRKRPVALRIRELQRGPSQHREDAQDRGSARP
jgi:transposase-like protein